ncbi:hypothetical protein Tco_0618592 [Tanacetum coccineum]
MFLPEVYNEEAFIDDREIYIISSEGYRYKVDLVTPDEGRWYLTGGRWSEFRNRSLNVDMSLFHFVEKGDDCLYVRDGIEFGGYGVNRSTFSRFMIRVVPYHYIPQTLLADFLPNLNDVDEIEISVNGLCALTEVVFKGAASLRRLQLPLTAFEQSDDRMKHVCFWPFHMDYFGEIPMTFYKSFSKIVPKNYYPCAFCRFSSYSYLSKGTNCTSGVLGDSFRIPLSKMIRFCYMSDGVDLDVEESFNKKFLIFYKC